MADNIKRLSVWCFWFGLLIPSLVVANASMSARLLWAGGALFWFAYWVLMSRGRVGQAIRTNATGNQPQAPQPAPILAYLALASWLPFMLALSAISWDRFGETHVHVAIETTAQLGRNFLWPIHQIVTRVPSESGDRVVASLTVGYAYFGILTALYLGLFYHRIYLGKGTQLRKQMVRGGRFQGARVLWLLLLIPISAFVTFYSWLHGPWIDTNGSRATAYCVNVSCFGFSDLGLVWATLFHCLLYFGFGPIALNNSIFLLPLLFEQAEL